jgi:uncharacterized protein (DUF1330 family)
MPAYAVFNYSITDREAYGPYIDGVRDTLEAAGAEIVVADFDSDPVEGEAGEVTVVLRFDSREQLESWYSSPTYEAIKPARLASTEGIFVVAEPGAQANG